MKHIDQYLQSKAIHNPETARSYRPHVARFGKDPAELTYADYLSFISFYRMRGYADKTVSYASTIFRDFCTFWGRDDIAKRIKAIRATANSWQPLNPDEFKKIDDALDDRSFTSRQIKLIHRFLWDCGLRVRELKNLSLFDFDPEHQFTEIITAKSKKRRIIAWSTDTHRLLLNHIADRQTIDCNDDPLFVTLRKKTFMTATKAYPITVKTIQRWLAMIGKELGIHLHPHRYRHGWAVKRIQHGAPLPFIQEGLGHTNPSATFVYTRYDRKQFLDQAQKHL